MEDDDAARLEQATKSAVELPLGDFVVHLDVARNLLSQVNRVTAEQPEYLRNAGKPLSAALRRDLDQRVTSALQSMPEVMEEAQLALLAEIPQDVQQRFVQHAVETTHHPLTPDEMASVQEVLVRQARMEERWKEALGDYKDDFEAARYFIAKMKEMTGKDLPERLLGAALLPALVSRFEEYLKALLRAGLRLYPNALGPMPDIPQELVVKYGHVFDLRRWQIERKVADLFKGTPDDWRKALLNWPRVDLAQQGGSWKVIVEAIQRRHVIVHNGGRADQKYLNVVGPGTDLVEGQPLTCTAEYLLPVFLEFEALALALSVRLARKYQVKSEFGVYPEMLHRVVDTFEAGGHWAHAVAVLEAALEQPLADELKEVYQINLWFCLQELGRQDDTMLGSIYAWRPSNVDARMARAALLRDEPYALLTIREVNASSKPALLKRHLRQAPLLRRFMKESVKVQKALSR